MATDAMPPGDSGRKALLTRREYDAENCEITARASLNGDVCWSGEEEFTNIDEYASENEGGIASTIDLVVPALVASAARRGIVLEVIQPSYDQVAQEALTP
jgi:hypothetical protein